MVDGLMDGGEWWCFLSHWMTGIDVMSGDASAVVGFAGVPGVPEGWELVRIGTPVSGDWVLERDGSIYECGGKRDDRAVMLAPIIRKAEPVCVWPRGVFRDGWIAQDRNGMVYWFPCMPVWNADSQQWLDQGDNGDFDELSAMRFILTPPVFRADLPFSKRIQKVGPAVEKAGGEVADG